MTAKLSDIAATVGVSASTVSRALSGRMGGNPHLVERITRVAEELGYPLDRYSAALARSRLLGVVVPNIASPFFSRLIECIEQAASHHGFNLLLCNSAYDLQIESDSLEILADKEVAGILISPVSTDSSLPGAVTHRRLPVVQVDRSSDRIQRDLVQTDSFQGSLTAVQLLLNRGYRRIAIISGPSSHSTGRERLAGYAAALRAASVTPDDSHIKIVGFREEAGYIAATDLLNLPARPDALFVTNVDMTIGALRAVYESGAKVPEELGIVAFDEFPFARIVVPPLTTIEQPIEMLASTAVDLLMRRIEQRTNAEPTTIRLLPKTNLRASVRPVTEARENLADDSVLQPA